MEINNNRILFVDDEELVLEKIKRKLAEQDFTMFFATSGREALQILEEEQIAVIIIDLSMPQFNGVKLLKMLNYDYPELVKIIFSAYSDTTTMLSALNSGEVYHYLPKKMVDKEEGYKIEFIPVLNRAVERYNLIQENKKLKKELEKKQ